MRSDMKHVIIDRPRIGGEGGKSRPPKGYKRRWQRMPEEDYPKSESSSRNRRKVLNEHLAPLRRWLRSNCGRPWDKVFSEICEGLSVRNATTAHVRDHAEQYVLKDTRLIDGVVCDSKGIPLTNLYWRLFYVHPRDGTLREAPRWQGWRRQTKEKDYVEGKDDMHQYRLLAGIWYEIEFASFSAQGLCGGVTWHEAVQLYGRCVYIKSKRQLGKVEIRKRRLWDTSLGRLAKS